MDALWFKNAVIYSLDVATFQDTDGDGIGDLPGVTERLDYLRGLGVTCLWLLPFFPTPDRDNGYDVSDYYGVDPRHGDLGDFIALLEAADELGIKVVVDLVVQHTSDEHPWFRAACSSRDSPYRDYYVWSDDPEQEPPVDPMFPEWQKGTWTWSEEAGQYYRHLFYGFEPDLDVANPAVRDEIAKVVRFWLRLGVSGFRIDAAPHLAQQASRARSEDDGHWYLAELRRFVESINPEAVLIAETDITPPQYGAYFGGGAQVHMQFNFYLNNFLWLSLARRDTAAIGRALQALPPAPHAGQYAVWLRNHDELDLRRLTEEERAEVLEQFAPDPDMQLFRRGPRRRAAPMITDPSRLRMAHALVFSLPGAPVLWYGEEIGMGDDLSLQERAAVRTPMQWSSRLPNAGFSDARVEDLVRPVLVEGPFGAGDGVTVEDESARRDSLLDEISRLVRVRRQVPEIGTGRWHIVDTGCPTVLGVRYDAGRSSIKIGRAHV